jgi:hypothetical protein
MSNAVPPPDQFEAGRILEDLWRNLEQFCTASSPEEAMAVWGAVTSECTNQAIIRLGHLRGPFIAATRDAGFQASEARQIYSHLEDAFRALRNRIFGELRSLHIPHHRQLVAKRNAIDLSAPTAETETALQAVCWQQNKLHLDEAATIYFAARNAFDRLVADFSSLSRPKKENKEEARTSAPPSEVIVYHGGQSYSIGGKRQFLVSDDEHKVLQTFLERKIALSSRDLSGDNGVSNPAQTISGLWTHYDGAFRKAVNRPGGKSSGGYFIKVVHVNDLRAG